VNGPAGAAASGPASGPGVAAPAARTCAFCGADLAARRSDARYCSAACRVEAWRLRRLLSGARVGRYATPRDRMAAFGRPRRPTRNTKAVGG
jgi:hypothetical protein